MSHSNETGALDGRTVFAIAVAASDLVFFAVLGRVLFGSLAFGTAVGLLVAGGVWLLTPAVLARLGDTARPDRWRTRLGWALLLAGLGVLIGRLAV